LRNNLLKIGSQGKHNFPLMLP